MRFWLTYLLTAAAGTALIHWGSPSLAAHADTVRRLAGKPPRAAVAAPRAAVAAPRAPTPAAALPVVRMPEDVAAQAQAPQPVPPAAEPETEPPPPAAEAAAETSAAAPQAVGAPPLYTPPPPDPAAASWGVVLHRAPHSGVKGNPLGPLPVGTVVEIQELLPTAEGDMAVCVIDDGGQWKGPVMIGLNHLVRFEGPLTDAPPEAVDLLYRYYRLRERIDARREAHRQRTASANPHAAAHARAVADQRAFDERVRRLTAQRDAASGPRRSQLIDQLHGMQAEGTRLRLNVEEARAKRDAWARENPQPANGPGDPELEGWIEELRRLEPEVKRYVP